MTPEEERTVYVDHRTLCEQVADLRRTVEAQTWELADLRKTNKTQAAHSADLERRLAALEAAPRAYRCEPAPEYHTEDDDADPMERLSSTGDA